MKNFINAVKLIEGVIKEKNGIISVDYQEHHKRLRVLVQSKHFQDLVEEDLRVQPCFVEEVNRNCNVYPIGLFVEKDGVLFETIMNEHEFEADFRSWLYDDQEVTDEEFVTTPKGVTSDQLAMKNAGMSFKDFR